MKVINKIIILIIIILLCISGYFIYKGKYNKKEIIKEQFILKLKEIDENSREKLLDYRIDEITILSDEEKQLLNNNGTYNTSDILAYVKYSVKPKDVNNTVWEAGNGEKEGEWIINKKACECLRNGKLVKSSGFTTAF